MNAPELHPDLDPELAEIVPDFTPEVLSRLRGDGLVGEQQLERLAAGGAERAMRLCSDRYPALLVRHPRVDFELRCQSFIELAKARSPPLFTSPLNDPARFRRRASVLLARSAATSRASAATWSGVHSRAPLRYVASAGGVYRGSAGIARSEAPRATRRRTIST